MFNISRESLAPTGSPASAAPHHINTLDGARGLAVLVVLVSHSGNEDLLPSFLGETFGKMGVMLFFLLSGFLMAHLYAGRPFGWHEILRYARHRVGRVLPLFYLMVLLSWFFAGKSVIWLFDIPDHHALADLLLLRHGEDVLWTIPVEIQYYIVFLFIWAMTAAGRPLLGYLPALVAGLALTALFWRQSGSHSYLPPWLWFFLFGSATALLYHRHYPRLAQLAESPGMKKAGWVVMAAAAFALPSLRRALHIPMLPTEFDPITAGYPVLFFLFALMGAGPFRVLASPPLRWLGAISYGAYIIHRPVLMSLKPLAEGHTGLGPLVFCGVVVLTLGLAWLSLKFYEQPAQRLIQRAGRRDRKPALAA